MRTNWDRSAREPISPYRNPVYPLYRGTYPPSLLVGAEYQALLKGFPVVCPLVKGWLMLYGGDWAALLSDSLTYEFLEEKNIEDLNG